MTDAGPVDHPDHATSAALAATGYVVLDDHPRRVDPHQWEALEYLGWRSSGVTRFAPLASAFGEIECNAFWNHTPPRADKGGVWIDEQVRLAPDLAAIAREPGADVGRCRVIELQPNTYADALFNLHHDDNNRLNPAGTGWVVRMSVNLTDDADSVLILRTDRDDPATETRIPLHAGSRVIVDTERFWHAVWHRGTAPRHALIVSLTSGPELDTYIADRGGRSRVVSPEVPAGLAAAAETEAARRRTDRDAERAALQGL